MLLYLPKDGSMLGLGGDKLILMCTYGRHLLGQDALCITSFKTIQKVVFENKLPKMSV